MAIWIQTGTDPDVPNRLIQNENGIWSLESTLPGFPLILSCNEFVNVSPFGH